MKQKLSLTCKTMVIKTFAVLMILTMTDATVFAQTRIRFARGRTSATVSGMLVGMGSKSYVVSASRGQTMKVRVGALSKSGRVWVDIGGNDVGRGTTIELRSTDDYIITVHNEQSSSTKFSLTVSIR